MEEPATIEVTVKTLDSQSRSYKVRGEVRSFSQPCASWVSLLESIVTALLALVLCAWIAKSELWCKFCVYLTPHPHPGALHS